MPGLPVFHYLPEFAQIHVYSVSYAISPSHPLLPSSPFAFNPSSIRVFSHELAPHVRWPKYWSFSFSISPSSEYSGLISFRIDWFDLLEVQGTLKRIFSTTVQNYQFFKCSAFFIVQLSHPYMTTGKTIALTLWGFPGGSDGKASACNVEDPGSIPGLGRSPGEGHGYPLQYSCLGNPTGRGAWRAAVHGVAKSQTQLND